jgi:hypothetical protein
VTAAYVKNIIRRGFNEAIDPEPDTFVVARIWSYFQNQCAYCGTPLDRRKREGRIDHAVSASTGGYNGLGNRVLACGPCNDDEKRDERWESFLARKTTDTGLRAERHRHISEWMHQHEGSAPAAAAIAAAQSAAAEVNALFDTKLAEIKALMRQNGLR